MTLDERIEAAVEAGRAYASFEPEGHCVHAIRVALMHFIASGDARGYAVGDGPGWVPLKPPEPPAHWRADTAPTSVGEWIIQPGGRPTIVSNNTTQRENT